MRLTFAALLVVAAAAAATATAAAPARSDAARVVVVDRSPLIVRGLLFGAGERVRVVVVVTGATTASAAKTVTAGSRGGWTVRFPTVSTRCGVLFVRATGTRGSAARYREIAPPCGIVPAP